MSLTPAVIRPDGGIVNNAGWAAVGGASIALAQADNTDGYYMEATAVASVTFDFAAASLPATAQVRYITLRVRASQATGTAKLYASLLTSPTHSAHNAQVANAIPSASIVTYSLMTLSANPATGAPWTQAEVDALRIYITAEDSASAIRVYEIYADVTYNEAPVITGTGPVGPQAYQPLLTSIYSDPESDSLERSWVKIYPASVYTAGGFNPESSSGAVFNSGEVFGAPNVFLPTAGLVVGTTYRAYVKAADAGSVGRYSPWSTAGDFSLASGPGAWLDPPAIPAVPVPVAQASLGRVQLPLVGQDQMLSRNQSSWESFTHGWEVEENLASWGSTAFLPQHGTSSLILQSAEPGPGRARTNGRVSTQAIVLTGATGNYWSTPHVAAHNVTDLDIHGKWRMADWTPATIQTLAAKDNGTLRAWSLQLLTTGFLRLNWWDNAAVLHTIDSTAAIPGSPANDTDLYLRVTLDVDNGATQHVVKFYWGNTELIWNQVGTTVTTAAVTTIRSQSTPITIGALGGGTTLPMTGRAYLFAMRSAIAAVGYVARFDVDQNGTVATPASQTPGSFVSVATGETWTGTGANWTWTGVYDSAPARRIPVTVGQSYFATATFSINDAPSAAVVKVLIDWLDSAGTLISTDASAGQTTLVGTPRTETVTATAPGGAVTAVVRLESAWVLAGKTAYVDAAAWRRAGVAAWTRGGLVQDRDRRVDTFDRANSSSTLGSAAEGGAWVTDLVTTPTWGIDGNRAYLVSSTADATAILGGAAGGQLADGVLEVDITLSPTVNRANAGVVFRSFYYGNGLRVQLRKTAAADDIRLMMNAVTVLTTVSAAGLVNGQTYRLRVEFYGATIRVLVDGVERINYNLSQVDHSTAIASNSTGTGLYVNYGAAEDDKGTRFDNFSATNPTLQRFAVQRSIDGGASWSDVRDATAVVGSGTEAQAVTAYDYEAPPAVNVLYRVKTHATEATSYAESAWVQAAAPVVLTPASWWLKDPLDPTKNLAVTVAPPFDFRRKNPKAIYDPLGRDTSVSVGDGVKGVEGTLNLWAKTKAAYDAIEALLGTGNALLLEDVLGRQWYVSFGDFDYSLVRAQPAAGETTPVRHFHAISAPFVEVAVPS